MFIIRRLEDWSMSRHITEQKPDVAGYVANITMELGEFLDVPKYKDEFCAIDAVADIVVFSITELFKKSVDYTQVGNILTIGQAYERWVAFKLDDVDPSNNEYNLSIVEQLGFFIKELPSKDHMPILTIINISLNKMITMGYNPILVMDEVLKVVESRTGAWDDTAKKFQKDMSPEAKAKWYKPNYAQARFV